MTVHRRHFLGLGAAALAAGGGLHAFASPASRFSGIEAIAFDAFAIFDPRSVVRACEAAFPDRGVALAQAWRTRQFEYQWLRALAGRYESFWDATESALVFAADSLELELPASTRERLMQEYRRLEAWPDVAPALEQLRSAGKRLAVLSNATPEMLHACARHAGLTGAFHHLISTDRVKSFKPDPRAYRLGSTVLELPTERIAFVAFAGWDAAGAGWFGYPTFWNNRLKAPAERLGPLADAEGASLDALVRLLTAAGGAA